MSNVGRAGSPLPELITCEETKVARVGAYLGVEHTLWRRE